MVDLKDLVHLEKNFRDMLQSSALVDDYLLRELKSFCRRSFFTTNSLPDISENNLEEFLAKLKIMSRDPVILIKEINRFVALLTFFNDRAIKVQGKRSSEIILRIILFFLSALLKNPSLRNAASDWLQEFCQILDRYLLRNDRMVAIDLVSQMEKWDERILLDQDLTEIDLLAARNPDVKRMLILEERDYRIIKELYGIFFRNRNRVNRQKLIASINAYILKYSAFAQARFTEEIDKMIRNLGDVRRELIKSRIVRHLRHKDLFDAASGLYKTMVESIQESDLISFVIALSLYTRLTAGHHNAPYKREVESIEEKIYPVLEKKSLWKKLAY